MLDRTWTDPHTLLVHVVSKHRWWDGTEERDCWATPCNMEAMPRWRPARHRNLVTCLVCLSHTLKGRDG